MITGQDPQAWYRATRKLNVRAKDATTGSLRIWREPFSCREKRCVCTGTGHHSYVLGGDVGKGLSHGDPSVGLMLDITAGEFVAAMAGQIEPDVFGLEMGKFAKYYGKSSGGDRDAFAASEWNENGLVANKIMDLMGIPQFIHKSDDKVRGKHVADKLGVVVTPSNRARLLNEYLIPNLGRAEQGGEFPRLVMPFDEFWRDAETFVLLTPKTGELNPDKPKAGAMRGKHDDWLFAATHAIYVAMMHFGKCKGFYRRRSA